MSLFDNLLRDPPPSFAANADDAQRLAQLRYLLSQASGQSSQSGAVGHANLPIPSLYPKVSTGAGVAPAGLLSGDLFERLAQQQVGSSISTPPNLPPVDMGGMQEMKIPEGPGLAEAGLKIAEAIGGKKEEKAAPDTNALLRDAIMKYFAAQAGINAPDGASSESSKEAKGAKIEGTGKSSDAKGPEGFTNNIGNLRATSIAWNGKGSPHNGFETFDTPANGAAAMFNNLRSYIAANPDMTVSQAIYKWAPPSENNSAAYVERVKQGFPSKKVEGVDPSLKLKDVLADPELAAKLLTVMGHHEKGYMPPGFTPDLFRSVVGGKKKEE
jgi:hypothetical protein